MGETLTNIIRDSGYKYSEDIVYSFSILIDRDLWVIEKIMEYGVDNFLKKIHNRAFQPMINSNTCMICLTFAWVSTISAIFNLVSKFKEENRDFLAKKCKEYGEELDNYIDTLDTLLNDETYNELVKMKIIEETH